MKRMEHFPQELLWGDLGDFVRGMLKGREGYGELIQDLKRELREEILQGMSYERQMTDEELAQVIDGKILEQMEREPMALRDRLRLQKELFDSFRRLDILQELVDDPGITEIMVDGPEEVFVETEGGSGDGKNPLNPGNSFWS